jgi:hypothetical protein
MCEYNNKFYIKFKLFNFIRLIYLDGGNRENFAHMGEKDDDMLMREYK